MKLRTVADSKKKAFNFAHLRKIGRKPPVLAPKPWTRKAKEKLLEAVGIAVNRGTTRPSSSNTSLCSNDLLVQVQRMLPERSREEIKSYIDTCISKHQELDIQYTKIYDSSVAKKWCELIKPVRCDSVGTSTMATIQNNILRSSQSSQSLVQVTDRSTVVECDFGKITEYISKALKEDTHEISLTSYEARILVDMLEDLEMIVDHSDTAQHEAFLKYKYQCSRAKMTTLPSLESDSSKPYDSDYLNPLQLPRSYAAVPVSAKSFSKKRKQRNTPLEDTTDQQPE